MRRKFLKVRWKKEERKGRSDIKGEEGLDVKKEEGVKEVRLREWLSMKSVTTQLFILSWGHYLKDK